MDGEELKRIYEGIFTRSATTYGQVGPGYFAHFGRRLVEFANPPAGIRVLDIACGRGAVLFPAAEAVGPGGEVIGVDLSSGMVAATQREITARGLTNASILQMDVEQLQFETGSFDFVLCGFALFFFPHLGQALSEIHRVLKPGGQVSVSTWGANRDPRWEWLGKLFKTYARPEPEKEDAAPAETENVLTPDFGTPEGVKAILAGAGFHGLRAAVETKGFVYLNEAEWWETNWSHGSRRGLEELERYAGAEGLERFKAEAFEHLRTYKTPEGFPQTMEVVFAAGQK